MEKGRRYNHIWEGMGNIMEVSMEMYQFTEIREYGWKNLIMYFTTMSLIELPLFAGDTVVTTMQRPFSRIVPLSKSIDNSTPTRNLCTYYIHAISEFYIMEIMESTSRPVSWLHEYSVHCSNSLSCQYQGI